MKSNNRLAALILLLLVLVVPLNAHAGLLNARHLKEQKTKKDEYFKNPQNKLMILIDQLQNADTSTFLEIYITTSDEIGSHGSTIKKVSPFVVVQDFSESVEHFLETYTAASEKERQIMLPLIDVKIPPMSIVASTASCNGLKAEIYFNGELIASDSSESSYPTVSVGFRLPIAKTVKTLYKKQVSAE